MTVGEELLKPHRCYLEPTRRLLEESLIRGMAHVTGGGITDNLPRILPDGCSAKIDRNAWTVPPVFETLVEMGRMETDEAFHAFNMGVGMALVVSKSDVDSVLKHLFAEGEQVWNIGEIVEGSGDVQYA